MTYREITDVIWNFLKEEHPELLSEKQELLERVQNEFYTEVVEKRRDYPVFTEVKELFRKLTEEYGVKVRAGYNRYLCLCQSMYGLP